MTAAVAVVGASLAGVHAARALRELGFDGRVVVFGDEPHAPYDRPPLSKEVLRGDWEPTRAALRAHDHDDGIDWRPGVHVDALDVAARTLTLADGTREHFDGGIVVATGTTPRTLPGTLPAGVHVLRTLDDAVALAADLAAGPEHVVVVGGGFIGGEVAASVRARGLAVTMVEVTDVPYARTLGREVGTVMADLHRAHGVDVVTGVGVSGVRGRPRLTHVDLADGRSLSAEVAVLGLGVVPDTTWLEGSGLTLDDGVVCDETLLAAPGVVVAGDTARWPDGAGGTQRLEHWDNAVRQGRHAAARLVAEQRGEPGAPYRATPWMWSDQYDVKVQVHGSTRGHDDVRLVHGSPDDGRFVALYGRDGVLIGALGYNRNRQVAGYRAMVADGAPFAAAVEHATAVV